MVNKFMILIWLVGLEFNGPVNTIKIMSSRLFSLMVYIFQQYLIHTETMKE